MVRVLSGPNLAHELAVAPGTIGVRELILTGIDLMRLLINAGSNPAFRRGGSLRLDTDQSAYATNGKQRLLSRSIMRRSFFGLGRARHITNT